MIKQFTFETYTFSTFQKSKDEQKPCGDSYWLKETRDEMIGVIADGLGSGYEAHLASEAAIETVRRYQDSPIIEIVHRVNEEQSSYRGVVLSIIKFNKKTKRLQFCGVGNINLKIVTSPTQVIQPRSKNGFLSGRPVELQAHEMDVEPNAWLIMYSDGIDFRTRALYQLYALITNHSYEEVNSFLKTTPHYQLNDDDVTILIGKPQ